MKYDAKAIEEMIEAYLPEETGHQKTVLAAMNYAVKAGGKRLRPMMLCVMRCLQRNRRRHWCAHLWRQWR